MNDFIEIGVDEAGYGPLLGSLNVCAYATNKNFSHPIQDSKKVYKNRKVNSLSEYCKKYFDNFNHEIDMEPNKIHKCEPWHKYFGLKNKEFDMHTFLNTNTSICTSTLYVSEFNKKVNEGLNKAQILISCIHEALKKVFSIHEIKHKTVHLKIDRLGGRKRYKDILKSWGANILHYEETDEISKYHCDLFEKNVFVSFEVKGDTKHHVIAAASCFAKLQRELSMKNFNEWWKQKIPLLKETAGYYTDGKRFITDIELYCKEHNIQLNSLERKL